MARTISSSRLLTCKDDIGATQLDTAEHPVSPADIVLKLDRFSLTANNITYAAFGDAPGFQYWGFFPTGVDGYGHMPVWGFADVIASSIDGIAVGERFYGYFPIADQIVMTPERITQRGFYDGAAHRKQLVSAYNQYTRCSADPAYVPEMENLQALYRPLFITSWMLADFLEDNGFFGARQLVVSSASSKTAYGAAYSLGDRTQLRVVGLTSARNTGFVSELGLVDAVASYADIATLDRSTPTLYVDFSGDAALRERTHAHFGDALVHDVNVGFASNQDLPDASVLSGPKAKMFFTPIQLKKRNADWGPAEVTRRYNEIERRFLSDASKRNWVNVSEAYGFDAAASVIAGLTAGSADPRAGAIIRLP